MAEKSAITPGTPNAVDKALAKGAQLAREEERTEIDLPLTADQEDKLDQLCDVLGLSVRAVLNTAVKYTLFYAEMKHLELSSLQRLRQDYPDPRVIRFEPSIETDQKLRESNMASYIRECALAGVTLLHERLIPRSEKAA
jgi:hypothetical protein